MLHTKILLHCSRKKITQSCLKIALFSSLLRFFFCQPTRILSTFFMTHAVIYHIMISLYIMLLLMLFVWCFFILLQKGMKIHKFHLFYSLHCSALCWGFVYISSHFYLCIFFKLISIHFRDVTLVFEREMFSFFLSSFMIKGRWKIEGIKMNKTWWIR